jgi:hypothetical protein
MRQRITTPQIEPSFHFKENKRKERPEYMDKVMDIDERKEQESKGILYISSVNAKVNPDLLMPSGSFLKGNLYFKSMYVEK